MQVLEDDDERASRRGVLEDLGDRFEQAQRVVGAVSAGELGEQAADDPGSRTGPLHQGGIADLLAQLAQMR